MFISIDSKIILFSPSLFSSIFDWSCTFQQYFYVRCPFFSPTVCWLLAWLRVSMHIVQSKCSCSWCWCRQFESVFDFALPIPLTSAKSSSLLCVVSIVRWSNWDAAKICRSAIAIVKLIFTSHLFFKVMCRNLVIALLHLKRSFLAVELINKFDHHRR